MLKIDPKSTPQKEVFVMLNGGIAPRPIAFASTIAADGTRNLSPFSFYNVFGSNPPMVAFSPSRRGRDGTLKDTYNNIMETGEVVINAVTYSMAEQMNLASADFDADIDEFIKSGFTPVDSEKVKPARVGESPFQMECKLHKMVNLGEKNGSGNLAICEVQLIHIAEDILFDGKIDPRRIDHIGRNGGAWYTRANGEALFEIPKPKSADVIGWDGLPEWVKNSEVLSGNDLGLLALHSEIPSLDEAKKFVTEFENYKLDINSFSRMELFGHYREMLSAALNPEVNKKQYFERTAKTALAGRDTGFAWKVLVYMNSI